MEISYACNAEWFSEFSENDIKVYMILTYDKQCVSFLEPKNYLETLMPSLCGFGIDKNYFVE